MREGDEGGERSLNMFELDLKQAFYVFKSRKNKRVLPA